MYPCTNCERKTNGRIIINIGKEEYRLCKKCTDDNLDSIMNAHKKGRLTLENYKAIEYFSDLIPYDVNKELNTLIGMNTIKKEVEKWIKQLKGKKKLRNSKKIKVSTPMMHMTITGNPGVGKTVLARKLASIFYQSGMLPTDGLIEVSINDLISNHVGETGQKTENKIREAINGVFFLDEAYRLAGDGLSGNKSDFGLEALETIMEAMEKYRGKIIFVFAGYEDRMEYLFQMNEGLRSRIAHHFKLEDYTPDELVLIGEQMLTSKGYNIDSSKKLLADCIKSKANNGVLIGNGRTVRNMIEKIIVEHNIRIGEEEVNDVTIIEERDIQKALRSNFSAEERFGLEQLFHSSLEELNGMIGLHDVKRQMSRIGNFQYIQSKRRERNLPTLTATNHMMFTGDPGTGKTTVARIVAKVLRGAGLLSNGHLVEISKDDLTGSRGATTRQVKKMVQKAKGGILFLDEAYTLTNDSQGKEALDALIKEMEENREDLVVIVAGYEKAMKKLLRANEGLSSRIPHHIHFPNYSPNDLVEMLEKHIEKNHYFLTTDARFTVIEKIKELHYAGYIDGNGRWIRNLFDRIVMAQSQRLVETHSENLEEVQELDILDAICEMEFQHQPKKEFQYS